MNIKRAARGVHVCGHTLRFLRTSLGWTQEEAAQRSGYSDRLIRKLERGGPAQPRTIEEVLQAYSVAKQQSISLSSVLAAPPSPSLPALARQWFQALFPAKQTRDTQATFAALVHQDVRLSMGERQFVGAEAILRHAGELQRSFDPLRLRVENLVPQGNIIAAFWRAQLRHVGEYSGRMPSGRWLELAGCTVFTFEQRKIVRVHDNWNHRELLQRLRECEIWAEQNSSSVPCPQSASLDGVSL